MLSASDTKAKVSTRVATSSDEKNIDRIHAMIHEAFRTEKSWATEAHIVSGERITKDALKEIVCDDKQPFILAELQDSGETKIVGCIRIQDLVDPKEKLLGLFSVDPAYQSKGIGGTLVATALDRMKGKQERAVIWVLCSRADVLAWYQRLGFYKTGETEPFPWPHLLKQKGIYLQVLKKDL
ncbi:acyl-CoA N-acyltransferase [Basidiobolus meristosporus CBS 931.73]|uniref:Acyl-CoA N-acyltransferase n=1 Tax=Basidiobolus meristosporus CBS 931.73 TaxID=1314790 RepID=A0A1Y1Z403_9FUNG|nr:acyl-CoA N-acyltransferase [Basidiobolus meristosporus CBS 931.73]|eukprot:ORY05001.1 acyl-CoA N-acyltransferase [Basidiobolus meristosporus CBS 931.73]